jgi:hypothetical protein
MDLDSTVSLKRAEEVEMIVKYEMKYRYNIWLFLNRHVAQCH